jgi:hypothetical protein
MGSLTPNPRKRGYLLPPGCKDLVDVLNGAPAKPPLGILRINGEIRAREVRVIDEHWEQLGIMPLSNALELAKSKGLNLVEIAPSTKPSICRLIDSKRRKKKGN